MFLSHAANQANGFLHEIQSTFGSMNHIVRHAAKWTQNMTFPVQVELGIVLWTIMKKFAFQIVQVDELSKDNFPVIEMTDGVLLTPSISQRMVLRKIENWKIPFV